jgi:hypothetical protein
MRLLASCSNVPAVFWLQAAFSHNGFAVKFDGTHDGDFRTVLGDKRISGPILITHTKNDNAVGIAHPLAMSAPLGGPLLWERGRYKCACSLQT